MVYEPEPRCCHLLVGVELQPKVVGSAGEGQTLHHSACVGAKEWRATIFAIIHLNRDRVAHDDFYSDSECEAKMEQIYMDS